MFFFSSICNLYALIVLLFQHLLFICFIFLLFQQLTLQLALVFSTLPFMTRVWKLNARKDCLVCIVGVIADGHYDQGRDLNAKLHDQYFIFNDFASKDSLSLIFLLHIKTDVEDDDDDKKKMHSTFLYNNT